MMEQRHMATELGLGAVPAAEAQVHTCQHMCQSCRPLPHCEQLTNSLRLAGFRDFEQFGDYGT